MRFWAAERMFRRGTTRDPLGRRKPTITLKDCDKVYHTGGGGDYQATVALLAALFWVAISLFIMAIVSPLEPVFYWPLSRVRIILFSILVALVLYAASGCLREHGNRVGMSAGGLLVALWYQSARFVPWEQITAVLVTRRWGGWVGTGYTLSIHFEVKEGHLMPLDLGYCHFKITEDMEELRETIIAHEALDRSFAIQPDFWEKTVKLLIGTSDQTVWVKSKREEEQG